MKIGELHGFSYGEEVVILNGKGGGYRGRLVGKKEGKARARYIMDDGKQSKILSVEWAYISKRVN